MSALENRFSFVDRTSQTLDMEKKARINFSFNNLSLLRVVVGQQKLHVVVTVCRWSSASLDEFLVHRLSLTVLLHSSIGVSTVDLEGYEN